MMKDVVEFLKRKLGKKLVAVVQFGSSVYSDKHEDVDVIVVTEDGSSVELPEEMVKRHRLSPLFMSRKDFALNCVNKSPLFAGILLSGYRVLYGHEFVQKWIPALRNRMKKSDILYSKRRVVRWT